MSRQLTVILLAGVLLVGLAVCPVQAQVGRIRTVGQGEVMVPPDTVEAQVSVRVQERTMAAARDQAATQMGRVLQAIERLNIPRIEIGTSQLSVTPVIRRPPEGQTRPGPEVEVRQDIVGYQVTNGVSIKIQGEGDELGAHVSRVLDAATTNGATNFSGPHFYRQDLGAAQAQALERATRDAIGKAEALARAAGVRIRNVTYVGMFPEQDQQPGPMPMMERAMMMTAAGGGAPTPVEVRDIQVTVQVWVTAAY